MYAIRSYYGFEFGPTQSAGGVLVVDVSGSVPAPDAVWTLVLDNGTSVRQAVYIVPKHADGAMTVAAAEVHAFDLAGVPVTGEFWRFEITTTDPVTLDPVVETPGHVVALVSYNFV